MRKRWMILLVLILAMAAGSFLFFWRGADPVPEGTIVTEPVPKNVRISDIEDGNRSVVNFSGDWIMFLHYSDHTQTADLRIDVKGYVWESSSEVIRGLQINIEKDADISMKNEKAEFSGTISPDGQYMKGVAILEGRRNPVPFSACRIENPEGQPE